MKKLLMAIVLSSAMPGVLGQTYPSKPIQLVVNSGPGAGADQTARALAERLGRRLGTAVVVENSAGAGGLIGAQAVKRAARDGYTLLSSSDSPVLLTALGANKDLDIVRDFPQQPDVPTLAESGVQNVEIQGYFFLAAPLGVPTAIVEKLNREANEILKTPDVREEFQRRGTNAAGGSAAQLGAKLRAEIEKWTAVARKAGIKPE